MAGIEGIRGMRGTAHRPTRRVEDASRPQREHPGERPNNHSTNKKTARNKVFYTGPSAAFIAQYINQNWADAEAMTDMTAMRHRATHAYLHADMLPELLAEAIIARPHGRKY